MSKRTLILIHRGPEYQRDFTEIAEKARAIDPSIDIHVCDTKGFRALPKRVWERPAFVVALTQTQLAVPRGAIVQSRQIDKIIQLRMAAAEGIAVPPALPFRFGMWLDPVMFGDYVVIKPRDTRLMSSGEGIHLFRRKRLQTIQPSYFPPDHPIFEDRVGYMVQRYVDQGPYPTYNRILTFLGRPIYMASGSRTEPRPGLSSPDDVIERANITIQSGPRQRRWGVDDDVEELARRIARCFSSIPLLAIDILREEKTGRPYFLECNPGGNTWHFAPRNSKYFAPLRPPPEAVAAVAGIIGAGEGPVLLLGVTPELAAAFEDVLAVDKSAEMIRTVWPGDSSRRKARCGDWLELALEPSSLRGIAGDGSLNNIPDPAAISQLLSRCMDWLEPGGTFACRVFERPAAAFGISEILAGAPPADDFNFHALKWMIAMHVAEDEGGIVPVEAIRSLFETLFPDRERLARDTGWPLDVIDTIDVYRGSPLSYYFPNRAELLGLLPAEASSVEVSKSGHYPLSDCCPVYSFSKLR